MFYIAFTVFSLISALLQLRLKVCYYLLFLCLYFSENLILFLYFFVISNHKKKGGALVRKRALIRENTVFEITLIKAEVQLSGIQILSSAAISAINSFFNLLITIIPFYRLSFLPFIHCLKSGFPFSGHFHPNTKHGIQDPGYGKTRS